jgi:multidrug efflux pump subunit AcrA (membrane-fusion protein)
VSTLATVDRTSPVALMIEAIVAKLAGEAGLDAVHEFDLHAFADADAATARGYPLRFLVWLPLKTHKGNVIAGLLQARMTPWTEADLTVSRHIAGACAQTLLALGNERQLSLGRFGWTWRKAAVAALVTVAVGLVPVSMTALAPVEVTPSGGFIVTAPVEGVVDAVIVEPNAAVKKDQLLVRMSDTVLRNRFAIAEREVLVAEARVKKSAQLAFLDARGRHELGVAQAELELKLAERDYARELLERSQVKADRDGVAFFSDPKDLIGRPVVIGERLMEIADPARVEFRIDLPAADAIVLRPGGRAKVFLDSDPLQPIEARVVRTDFQARVRDGQLLAFRLVAERADQSATPLRLGARGTAQVYSDKVTLAFYLFRRPISAARQWLGL